MRALSGKWSRGSLMRFMYRRSARLALREGLSWPPQWSVPFWSVLNDLLGSVSVRWAEETVLIARKPENVCQKPTAS